MPPTGQSSVALCEEGQGELFGITNPAVEMNGVAIELNGTISKEAAQEQNAVQAADPSQEKPQGPGHRLLYGLEDRPPLHLSFMLGLQHFVMMVGGTVSIPFIIAPKLCLLPEDPARSYILSSILFVSGMVTVLQTSLGVRLPIIQGGTFAVLVPALALLSLPENQCPAVEVIESMSEEERTELWQSRIRLIQGSLAIASLLQVLLGFTGAVGLVLRFITPVSVVPLIALVGLSLFDSAANSASKNWGLAAITIAVIIIFSQYMKHLKIPFPYYSRKGGFKLAHAPIFELFPIILAILVSWFIAWIFTISGVFAEGNGGRTDSSLGVLKNSPWFRFPYPCQWGMPVVTTAGVLGMIAAILSSIVESIGDYYACARLCGAPSPPVHAINRGIGIEGVGSVLAALFGTSTGTTSYSENIGAIGISKVGSRQVIFCAGLLMMVCGVVSKLGAIFVMIPEPIIGGIFCTLFGVIAAVGLSNLQFVDLNSTRNIFILGVSLFMGLAVPKWMQAKGSSVIDTGSRDLDALVTVLLSTSMFVGGFLAFFLDNTVSGTDEERGITKWLHSHGMEGEHEIHLHKRIPKEYDLPFGMSYIRKWKWMRHVPFSPTYDR